MIEILKQRLEEAETAHHKLIIGQGEVSVDVDGFGEVVYNRANIEKLERYIGHLRIQIRTKTSGVKRRVAHVSF